jgi:hypothetical protein
MTDYSPMGPNDSFTGGDLQDLGRETDWTEDTELLVFS